MLAISALQKPQIQSIRKAAHDFQVPYTTLKNRLEGRLNQPEKRANSHKLAENEESLLHWILSMDWCGAAPRPAHIQDMANLLLLGVALLISSLLAKIGRPTSSNAMMRLKPAIIDGITISVQNVKTQRLLGSGLVWLKSQ